MTNKSSLTIFFPCYNDSHTIGKLIRDAHIVAAKLTSDFEVIVVNDGSIDASANVLSQLQKNYRKLKVITHPKNLGYGAALRSGFASSTKDLVFYTDGDGQYSLEELPIVYQLMTPDVDFVNGIKMTRHDSTYRIIMGNLYSFVARWVFWLPVTDVDCDYRLIRRSLLQKLKLSSVSGNICVELVKKSQRAHGSFREISVHHYERKFGQSQFFQLSHLSTTFYGLAKLWSQLILFHKFPLPRISPRFFKLGLGIILLSAFVIRIVPPLGNNLYFTMDQANDALHVRELLVNHTWPLLGPETSIPGIYVGSLWYYFIAIGYGMLGGHPFGGVVMLIILNVLALYLIVSRIARELSPAKGLIIGLALLTSWGFYNLSRYSFNPFPNFFLSVVGILWLTDFTRGRANKYLWTAIPFGLLFHTDLAPALPANLMYIGLGITYVFLRKLPIQKFFAALFILFLFFIPHIASEFTTHFSQTQTIIKEIKNPGGVFRDFQTKEISQNFYTIVSRSLYRQTPEVGVLFFALLLLLFFRKLRLSSVNSFTSHFMAMTLLLFVISWLFFITNLGWRDWQTSFLTPLVFLAVLLILTEMPTLIFLPLFFLSMYSHLNTFVRQYRLNLRPTQDQSLLVNEMTAVDWVYAHSQGQGFTSYAYLPSVYDYPYQYLYAWHGLAKYGYLPCEYSAFPGDLLTYMINAKDFRAPTRDCPSSTRFLIIEPDKNEATKSQWITAVTKDTDLVAETKVGNITIQKRKLLH